MNELKDVFAVFFVAFAIIFGIITVFNLILWVLQAIGLQKIAKRNNIDNSWLAWLPIGDLWILGKISDTRKKFWKIKNTGKTFVILSIAQIILGVIFLASFIPVFISDNLVNNDIALEIYGSGIKLIEFLVGLCGAGVLILKFLSLYNLYSKYKKEVAPFLIFSVLFQFLIPVFIFIMRNKEEIEENFGKTKEEELNY